MVARVFSMPAAAREGPRQAEAPLSDKRRQLDERADMIERSEITTTLQCVKLNAERQEGGPNKRTLICELMLAALAVPEAGAEARTRLRVIAGGTGNDPEPPAAA